MKKIKYLFKDELLDDGAPLSSPHPAEPGPGSWSVVDSDSSYMGGYIPWHDHAPPNKRAAEFQLVSWAELSEYNDAYHRNYLETHPKSDSRDAALILALHNPTLDYVLKLVKASKVYGDMHSISMRADAPGVWHFDWSLEGSDDVRHLEIHHDELTPDSLAALLSN